MSWRYACGAFVMALLAGAAAMNAGPTAGAQGKNDDFDVLIGYAKDAVPASYQRVALRPTAPQPVFVHLRNPTVIPRANLSIKLVRLNPQGKPEVVAEATVAKLAGVQTQLLAFKPAAPKEPPPPKDAPPPKDKLPEPPGYAPPFLFQLWIDDGQKTAKKDLPIVIQQPHEYVTATAGYDRANRRLAVDVAAKEKGFADPDCAVQLVLNRELLPGLILPKDASLVGKLTRDRDAVELHATNVQFEQGVVPRNGRVYLHVDGYERAYGFRAALDQGAVPALGMQYRIRVRAPRYFVPKGPPPDAPKPPPPAPKPVPVVPVQLEVDGLLDQDVSVEVEFDRNGNGSFVREFLFPGLRQQTLKLAVGDDGSLTCTPAVKDWKLDLNVEGIRGRRSLRVRLLNAAGLSLPLANDGDMLLFSKDVDHEFAPLAPDINQGRIVAVFADLFINDTGPEDVRLVGLPAKVLPGQTVRLKATARKRDETLQAPISKVQFIIGDPDKDRPLPAVLDVPTNTWQYDYKVPSTAKESLAVTVKMSTAAGLTESAKGSMAVADPATVTAATVKGVVVWNNNPQPGLEVKLLDAKGKPLKATQTGPAGAGAGLYAFEEVPPGSYILFASKINFRGQRPVTVLKGQAVVENQEIELKRN